MSAMRGSEDAAVSTFEMLVERLTNVEISVESLVEDRIASYEMLPTGSRIPGVLFGCRGMVIHKHCDGAPSGLVYVDDGRNLSDGLRNFHSLEWCGGTEYCWMDEHVSAKFGHRAIHSIKSECETVLTEDFYDGCIDCCDVGLPVEKYGHRHLIPAWFEIAAQAKVSGLVACGYGGIILHVPLGGGLKWIVDAVMKLNKLLDVGVPMRLSVAEVPPILFDVMVAIVRVRGEDAWEQADVQQRSRLRPMLEKIFDNYESFHVPDFYEWRDDDDE